MTKNGLNAFCAMALGLMLGCSNGCGGAEVEKRPSASSVQVNAQAQTQDQTQTAAPVDSDQEAEKAPDSEVQKGPASTAEDKGILFCEREWPKDTINVDCDCHTINRDLNAGDFAILYSFEQLERLSFSYCIKGMQDLNAISRLDTLKYLFISGPFSEKLSPLKGFSRLETIEISLFYRSNSDVSAISLDAFANLANLTEIIVPEVNISDFSALRRMTQVDTLFLRGEQLRAARSSLKNVKKLEIYDFRSSHLSSSKDFHSIEELVVQTEEYQWDPPGMDGCKSCNSEIEKEEKRREIGKIMALRSLSVFDNVEILTVRAQGLPTLLPLLSLKKLRVLNLECARSIEDKGSLKTLQNKRPGIKILLPDSKACPFL